MPERSQEAKYCLANNEYRTGDPDRPVGQIDAYIEGLRKEDLE